MGRGDEILAFVLDVEGRSVHQHAHVGLDLGHLQRRTLENEAVHGLDAFFSAFGVAELDEGVAQTLTGGPVSVDVHHFNFSKRAKQLEGLYNFPLQI